MSALTRHLALPLFFLGVIMAPAVSSASIEGTVAASDWIAYRDRFVRDDGRVVDDANGGISHSEGQGYGLLLAFAASDRATFDRIWSFARDELFVRDDGLAAWKWDPHLRPRVADTNNATDGDILIAYALGLAGQAWDAPKYTEAARRLAKAIGSKLVQTSDGLEVLAPGAYGFGPKDRRDKKQVLNLSYWVFEAFPLLERLAPDFPWDVVASSGIALISSARFGAAELPSDWVAITKKGPLPAAGFSPVFGYNSIRIPLYLIRAGELNDELLAQFIAVAKPYGLAVVDIESGQTIERLTDPGYRMVAALVKCAGGAPIPADLLRFEATSYYPSTLHLLALSYLAERRPRCL